MKKVLAVVAIAAFMVACNNGSGTETETTTDTTVAPVTNDQVVVPDSAVVPMDSTMVDSTKQ